MRRAEQQAVRWLLVVAMVASGAARAQAMEHELASWSLLTVWGREGKARWFAEAQPRVSLTTGRFDRLLLRPAVGFQLTPEVSLWAGYGWTPSFTPSYRDEQRPWQQLLVEQRFGVVSLVNHAEDANAGVWQEYERELVVLEALRPIAAGEEITIHYDVELWFDAV